MSTATLVRKVPGAGDARLYRLSEPLDGHDFVVVSAVVAYSGPETYIFAATDDGGVCSYGELRGSFRGALNHKAALRNAGYEEVQS